MKGWIKCFSLDLDYIRVFVEKLMTDIIGSRLSLAIKIDLGFCYVQSEYYIREKLIRCVT